MSRVRSAFHAAETIESRPSIRRAPPFRVRTSALCPPVIPQRRPTTAHPMAIPRIDLPASLAPHTRRCTSDASGANTTYLHTHRMVISRRPSLIPNTADPIQLLPHLHSPSTRAPLPTHRLRPRRPHLRPAGENGGHGMRVTSRDGRAGRVEEYVLRYDVGRQGGSRVAEYRVYGC